MAFPDADYVTASHTSVGPLTDPSPPVDLSLLGVEFWALVDTSDGTKGRIFKEDGTELAVVWLSFDDGAETGGLRFKWSGTWSAAGANTVRIYPPLAARASVAAGDTFGSFNAFDDDWAAYYPMGDASGGIADQTRNAAHLAEVGSPTYGVSGQVGDAITLGLGDYFKSAVATVTDTPMTIMAWGKADDAANFYALGSVADASTTSNFFALSMRGDGGGDPIQAAQFGSTQFRGASSTSGFSAGTWHHATGRFVSDVSRFAYIDGANEGFNGQSTGATTGVDTTSVGIIGDSTPTGDFEGSLQELQFHKVDRGVDWDAEEFAATKNPGTYWGVWEFVTTNEGEEEMALEIKKARGTIGRQAQSHERHSNQSESGANLTVSTSTGECRRILFVIVKYSGSASVSVTTTLNSGAGAAWDVILNTITLSAATQGLWIPDRDVIISADDVIDVFAPLLSSETSSVAIYSEIF